MLLFGVFIYIVFTPLPLSVAETVNALLIYLPVVDVLAPFIVGAPLSIWNVNEPLKPYAHPARELIGPPPLPDIDTEYVPSVKFEAVAFLLPEPILFPFASFMVTVILILDEISTVISVESMKPPLTNVPVPEVELPYIITDNV